jgi:death-on-curing protein
MKVRYLTYNEILDLYREQNSRFGGFCAIRDSNSLLSIVANPRREFGGQELYPTISAKVAILVFSIIKNHPFVDGNKRTAYICDRVFLRLNGYDLSCDRNEFKQLILNIASSKASLEDTKDWFQVNIDRKDSLSIRIKERKR